MVWGSQKIVFSAMLTAGWQGRSRRLLLALTFGLSSCSAGYIIRPDVKGSWSLRIAGFRTLSDDTASNSESSDPMDTSDMLEQSLWPVEAVLEDNSSRTGLGSPEIVLEFHLEEPL